MNARASEASTLADLGEVLRRVDLPPVAVRLPAHAVTAWHREDTVPLVDPEPLGDRRTRQLAGTLALIGLVTIERGRQEGDEAVVPLPIELAGAVMDAADTPPAS